MDVDAPTPTRVTILEDHPLVAETLARSLGRHGVDARFVTGPALSDAVEDAARFAGHLVLLDLDLGMLDGRSLIGPLRDAGARVVVLTGMEDRAALGEAIALGAEGVVSKKDQPHEILTTVVACIDGRPAMSPEEREELLDDMACAQSARRRMLEPFGYLTYREAVVLGGVMDGLSAAELAARDEVSIKTVHTQIGAVLTKLGVHSQLAAVALAERAGWTPLPPA